MDQRGERQRGDALYRLEVEDLSQVQAPIMVHALRGALDAGSVGELVASHLLDSLHSRRVATFDVDALIDYRSRRPSIEIENFRFTDYNEPVLAVDLLADDEGHPLLLLHGCEPDLRWEAFVRDVIELVKKLGVERTVGVHGFPTPVPHTRPAQVQTHGDALPELDEQRGIMLGAVQMPGSASALVEYRLQQQGRTATGFSVSVPHYLSQNVYPAAAAEAVRWISRAGDLALPVGDLEAAAAEMAAQVEQQIEQSPKVAGMVRQLETQFDQYAEVVGDVTTEEEESLPPPVPSADEIGAEAEAFLAKQMMGFAWKQDSDASTDASHEGGVEKAPSDAGELGGSAPVEADTQGAAKDMPSTEVREKTTTRTKEEPAQQPQGGTAAKREEQAQQQGTAPGVEALSEGIRRILRWRRPRDGEETGRGLFG